MSLFPNTKWCLTAALLITVVRAVPLLVADIVDVDALPRIADELSRYTGGFWAPAQALKFIRAILAVCITITCIR